MCTPLGGPNLWPPRWSVGSSMGLVHDNLAFFFCPCKYVPSPLRDHPTHYISIHYSCINACFHCIYKYIFEYNNTTPIESIFLILQTKIILYIMIVEIIILKSRYHGIQSVYIYETHNDPKHIFYVSEVHLYGNLVGGTLWCHCKLINNG